MPCAGPDASCALSVPPLGLASLASTPGAGTFSGTPWPVVYASSVATNSSHAVTDPCMGWVSRARVEMSSSGAPATTAVPETATAAPTRAPRDASWAISVCGGAQAPSSPLNVYTSPWLPSGDGSRGAPTASVPASSATAAPNSASLCSSPAGMVSVCACVQPPAAYANANAAPWSRLSPSCPGAPTTASSPSSATAVPKCSPAAGVGAVSRSRSLHTASLRANAYTAPSSSAVASREGAPTSSLAPSSATEKPKLSSLSGSDGVSRAASVQLDGPPPGSGVSVNRCTTPASVLFCRSS